MFFLIKVEIKFCKEDIGSWFFFELKLLKDDNSNK